MWHQIKNYGKSGLYVGGGIIASALIIAAVRFVASKVKV